MHCCRCIVAVESHCAWHCCCCIVAVDAVAVRAVVHVNAIVVALGVVVDVATAFCISLLPLHCALHCWCCICPVAVVLRVTALVLAFAVGVAMFDVVIAAAFVAVL